MSESSRTDFNAKYLAARQQNTGILGYGLGRRTRMLVSAIEAALPSIERHRVDVVDFGCADAAMLRATAQALGPRHGSSVGLDVFRTGAPPDGNGMRFLNVDLFKNYPYPLADQACDIAIASAFMKHHPDTRRFLSEVARVLRPGGIAVLLDPRPFAVKVGQMVGKFSRDYNPSPWSRQSVTALLDEGGIALRPHRYERYWVSPTQAIYDTGVEKLLSRSMVHLLALHQCMVLKRT
jgi:SAM-dependent methyltransferase